jgi:hypothetical protein
MRHAVWLGMLFLALTGNGQAQTNSGPTENPTMSDAQIRELLDAAKVTAKASRENVDYARVVPDILFQILAKLDKIEDKLDKVENAIKSNQAARANRR